MRFFYTIEAATPASGRIVVDPYGAGDATGSRQIILRMARDPIGSWADP